MFFLLDAAVNPDSTSFIEKCLTPETICTMITVIGSVLTVSITYYKTQKLKQFEVFFSYKTRSYEKFWDAVSEYYSNPCEEKKLVLRSALHSVSLYSPEETFNEISSLVAVLLQGSSDIADHIDKISILMRKDLNQSQKGKLY